MLAAGADASTVIFNLIDLHIFTSMVLMTNDNYVV